MDDRAIVATCLASAGFPPCCCPSARAQERKENKCKGTYLRYFRLSTTARKPHRAACRGTGALWAHADVSASHPMHRAAHNGHTQRRLPSHQNPQPYWSASLALQLRRGNLPGVYACRKAPHATHRSTLCCHRRSVVQSLLQRSLSQQSGHTRAPCTAHKMCVPVLGHTQLHAQHTRCVHRAAGC